MQDFIALSDHLLPVVITILVAASIIIWFVGRPYLQYTHLVAEATDDTGIIKLAKYLAHKAGGRGINVDHAWESFVPAAKEIRLSYMESRINTLVDQAVENNNTTKN